MRFSCKNCNQEFFRKPCLKPKYCSRKCSIEDRKNSVEVTCAICFKVVTRHKSDLKNSKSGIYFCSRACKAKAQTIESRIPEIVPSHYGTGMSKYRNRAIKELPQICENCGYDKYPEILEVHHKDYNRFNNELTNLQMLCPNCHQEVHFTTKTGRYSKSGP